MPLFSFGVRMNVVYSVPLFAGSFHFLTLLIDPLHVFLVSCLSHSLHLSHDPLKLGAIFGFRVWSGEVVEGRIRSISKFP